jgi:glycerophosphoryl diester phosphodiesterase
MENTEKLIIAHRGASGYMKENTLSAFQKAVELGADMIEFDVRKTGDGKLVIIHDEKIGGRKISELTLEEINNIAKRKSYKILELEEALKFLWGKIKLDIELKETGYEEEVMDLVLRYFSEEEFIVTSFYSEALAKIKNKYPKIKTGLLIGQGKPQKFIRTYLKELFPYLTAKKIKADWLLPNWRFACIPFYITTARLFSLPVIVWTVNRKSGMKIFLKHKNVHGAITDYLER